MPCELSRGHNPTWPPLHLPPRRAIVALALPSAKTTPLASLAQVLMPSRRRQRATTGPPWQGPGASEMTTTAANGRRTRALCAGEGSCACTSAGGVRGARWAPAVARAADVRRPLWPRDLAAAPYGPRARDRSLGEPREAQRPLLAGQARPGGAPGSRWDRPVHQ